jgi:DNA-binding NarL/FixJ family response regulator
MQMLPNEAKKIIETLANGMDPKTGRLFPEQSVFNNPLVIRALFTAADALGRMARASHTQEPDALQRPEAAGRAWTRDEEVSLLTYYDAGQSVKEIADKVGRTETGIAARLVRLGRIKNRASAYDR